MGDLEAELFGDYDSADEGAAGQRPAGNKPLPNEDDLADELFGDGDGEGVSTKGKLKRPQEADAGQGERKVKRRKDLAKFFETEAEEAGGSADEDDDGDLADLIDDSGVEQGERGRSSLRAHMQRQDRELEELQREMAARGKDGGSGAQRVFGTSFLDKLEEKYQAMEDTEAATAVADEVGVPAPPSPVLSLTGKKETNAYVVPDARDPKLWVVKTFGPEKGLCISLMRKASEFFAQGKTVPIFSVFYSEHLRGYIYVEAFKESDCRDFVRGIAGISLWDIKLVPTTQMPQVFMSSAVDADKHAMLKVGDWVRLKRGPYKGDLAQIDEVKDDTAVVKLKPRLRYGLEAQKTDRQDKAHVKRPQPRWFNRADVEAGGLMVNTERRFTHKGYLTFFIVGDDAYRDGFLYKSFRAHWFDMGDRVRPLEHELQDWRFVPPVSENTRPEADLAKSDDSKLMPPPALPKKVAPQRTPLVEGDVIIVHSGDLKNLRGVVTKAIFGSSTVLVRPMDVASLDGELNISITLLSKYFQLGDYVKAIAGEHEGDTGYVLKVVLDEKGGWGYNATARVLSTSISSEFTARIDHLQLTAQKADPQDVIGEFAVGRLVRLEGRQNSRGLIVRLEAGTRALVLCTDGTKHDVSFGDMEPVALPERRTYQRSVWTMDRKGKKILPGCIVKCPRTYGRTAPIKAEVLYIHNEFCFLKAVDGLVGERAYLVCPGTRCEFVFNLNEQKLAESAAAQPKEAGKTETKEAYGVVMASETNWLQPWFKKMMGIEEERGKAGSLKEMGTSVRIHGGAYKGLRGEVRDWLQDKVRVSLLAKPKLVVVKISDIAPDDYERPRSERFPSLTMAPATPNAAPGTPFTPASPSEALDGPESLPALEAPQDLKSFDEPVPGGEPRAEVATDGDATAAAAAPAAAAPAAAAPAVGHSDTDEASSVQGQGPSKRRKPRLPSAAGSASKPAVEDSSRLVSQSPSALFGQPERPRSRMGADDRAPWLVAGVGVRYTRDSLPCRGWIVKVYADMAHVVSSEAEVGDDSDIHAVKGSETQPLECAKRGEMVYVFDGPRKGTRGKVIGVEKETVYLRIEHADKGKHTLLFASAAGSDMARVQKKDVAGFSKEWEQAAEERGKRPPAAPPAPKQASDRPWWDVDSEPEGGIDGTALASPNLGSPQSPSTPAVAGDTAGAPGAAAELPTADDSMPPAGAAAAAAGDATPAGEDAEATGEAPVAEAAEAPAPAAKTAEVAEEAVAAEAAEVAGPPEAAAAAPAAAATPPASDPAGGGGMIPLNSPASDTAGGGGMIPLNSPQSPDSPPAADGGDLPADGPSGEAGEQPPPEDGE